ncbi:hypothetical protein O0L34_g6675 [Tuta absoluta]|nr:hypothetical protein O0L34_g6675 [Tuta absoluta]
MSRTTWQVIATETCRSKNKNTALDILISKSAGRSHVQRAGTAAEQLNRFYVDANKNANTHSDITTALSYLCKYTDKHVNTLCIEKFSLQHFTKTIKNIKRKHSRDINDMSTHLFDLIPTFIFQIICELFNRCVEVGTYPDSLKQVKIQPIYKGKGEMNELKNFRPISLIPIFSKAFERLISDRLMSYFNTNRLLNKQQFAYQPGRSTVDAARDVIARVMTHLEGGRQVAAIFCDLSRAFELVSHPLLLAKLDHYGVLGNFHHTIASFLRNRSQLTYVHGTRSDPLQLGGCAVPQGSIMGNNLFLLIMNDFTTSSDDAEFVMFADDGCVIVSADSYDLLKNKLSKVMNEIALWFSANGMILNVDKTNIVHFELRKKISLDLNIYCNGLRVPQVKEVKYLGIIIDSGLTWGPHIDALCNRLSSACFALSRLKATLSIDNLMKAYYGYFNSISMYAIDLWANAAERDRVFRLQKRAVRIMCGAEWDHPAKELFIKMKILTLPSLYILEVAKYVRQNIEQFQTHGDTHSRNTRQRHNLWHPKVRLAKYKKSLNIIGPRLYNKIPCEIKQSKTYGSFVRKLKTKLVNDAVYSINEFFISPSLPQA